MQYISTQGHHTASLRQAVEQCYGPDSSLYIPASLPLLPKAYLNNIEEMSLCEIAYVIMTSLLGDSIEAQVLKDIVDSTFNFPVPLVETGSGHYALELFHGPTMAFKDAGARFMSAIVGAFPHPGKHAAVLVATTGNTGGAVANALSGMPGTDVYVLYPRGILTRAQQSQFSTAGANIHPIEVAGSIAQCKSMVREALTDLADNRDIIPVCANTHNILRILPQIVFFFHAYARLREKAGAEANGFSISIPCGNMSNLTAAVMARRMGLPAGKLIAGCNANDDFVRLLEGSISLERMNRAARPTLAWAMDCGFPVNLPRLMAYYNGDIKAMGADIAAAAIDDDTISATIIEEINRGYAPDPHTAVAIAAARLKAPADKPTVVLATAHPAKSLDKMTAVTGRTVELPLQFTRFMSKPRTATKIAPTYPALKKIILNQ